MDLSHLKRNGQGDHGTHIQATAKPSPSPPFLLCLCAARGGRMLGKHEFSLGWQHLQPANDWGALLGSVLQGQQAGRRLEYEEAALPYPKPMNMYYLAGTRGSPS